MTIDAYLAALRRRLPLLGRRRALLEVREHLRDSARRYEADGLGRHEAELAATVDFGDVDEVARRLATECAVLETRVAAAGTLAAVAFFVFPLYVVPENTLAPAQWGAECAPAALARSLPSSVTGLTIGGPPDRCSWALEPEPSRTVVADTAPGKPYDILVLQIVSVALWVIAGAFAAAGVLLAWTRWSRFAAPVVRVVPFAIAGSIAVSVALVVRWLGESPVSVWWPVLGAPLAILCLLLCTMTAGWASSRQGRLSA